MHCTQKRWFASHLGTLNITQQQTWMMCTLRAQHTIISVNMIKSAVQAPLTSNSVLKLCCVSASICSDTDSRPLLLYLLFDHNWSLASCFSVERETGNTRMVISSDRWLSVWEEEGIRLSPPMAAESGPHLNYLQCTVKYNFKSRFELMFQTFLHELSLFIQYDEGLYKNLVFFSPFYTFMHNWRPCKGDEGGLFWTS